MSDTVIQVENLGKRYRIGQREKYLTLREAMSRHPLSEGTAIKMRKASFGLSRMSPLKSNAEKSWVSLAATEQARAPC
jgi:hypothetical protein